MLIQGPTLLSFSGGRTSGYMLARALREPARDELIVAFANTGDEHDGTLDFVRECGERWAVPIRWIEYRPTSPGWAEVSFATASRNGEPFDALIAKKKFLPNPVMRFCTEEMKAKTIRAFMASLGFKEWTTMIGIRSDEPRRVARMRARVDAGEDIALPLADDGVTQADVMEFWKAQSFDLRIPAGAGNCVGCFMKGAAQLVNVFADVPGSVDRWVDREKRIGARVRSDRPPYAALGRRADQQIRMFDDQTSALPCECHD